jgi:hypothetical protein
MNKKLIISIILGIVVGTTLLAVFISPNERSLHSTKLDFSYVDSNSLIKSSLNSKGIAMSNPLKFSGESVAKYCTFFEDKDIQKSIEYCTSTELRDSHGTFLGNIHMVGKIDHPNTVLGVIQIDPLMSKLDSVKTIYQTMLESLVCDCWENKKPGDFDSVSAWIDAVKTHHLDGKRTVSKSKIDGLAQKQLLMEITTNKEGYLWKFIITN